MLRVCYGIFESGEIENQITFGGLWFSGLLKLDTRLSGNLPLERSVHYEEKTHV